MYDTKKKSSSKALVNTVIFIVRHRQRSSALLLSELGGYQTNEPVKAVEEADRTWGVIYDLRKYWN